MPTTRVVSSVIPEKPGRLLCEPEGLVSAAQDRRTLCLRGAKEPAIRRVVAEGEHPLGLLEVRTGFLRPAVVVEDLSREEVGPRDLQGVLRELRERPRMRYGREGRVAVSFHPQEPRPLPMHRNAVAEPTSPVGSFGRLV